MACQRAQNVPATMPCPVSEEYASLSLTTLLTSTHTTQYEEPSLLEVFYDLFFAANYTVFSQNQSVVNHESFKAYIGYFSLLWATWFAVTLYDVRYVADSLFGTSPKHSGLFSSQTNVSERITRATQLGVLVGFAVVAPNFDPEKQTDKHTYKTMMTMCKLSL